MKQKNFYNLIFVISLLALFLFPGLSVSAGDLQTEDERHSAYPDYKIGPGDVIEITVYGEDDLTKEVRVSETGSISYPLLGRLNVSGLTAGQTEKMLHDKLGARFLVNPQVTVFVKSFSKVFVYGEVEKPGSYPMEGSTTVLEAITMAEGLTEVANPRNVKVIRSRNGRKKTMKVNLNDITKKGEKDKDIILEPDDVVVVAKSFF